MVFRGNIVTGITGNTFSDQGMLFGTFLMKNIFIDFPTPFLNYIFCMILSKNPIIFIGFVCCSRTKPSSLLQKSWNFQRNRAKTMIQNRSWKIDENIFHQKCPKQHSLVTENVSSDVCDDISSKNRKNPCFFMFADYCRDSNSKCTHYSIALQKRVFLWGRGARSKQL